MSIEFATAAAFQQTESNRRLTRVFVPAVPRQPVVSPPTRTANFTDCMEMTFACLVFAGALLFAAALLRFCWIDGQTACAGLRFSARIVYAAAGATGCAAFYCAGRGIYHLIRR